MRRIIAGTLALTVLSSTWLLGAEQAKTKAKAKAKAPAPSPVSAQLQQMKDQLNQQQQQINQLQQQLQQSNQQLQSAQQQLQSGVQQAAQQAAAAQQASASAQQTANSMSSSIADLKTSNATLVQSVAVTQKDIKELQSPLTIKYKGVSITPIGFTQGVFFYRTANVNSDYGTPLSSFPLNNNVNHFISENRFSARGSRLAALVQGKPNATTTLSGYWEFDFMGTSIGPSGGQSSNWVPRLRQAWMTVDRPGYTVTVGQDWTLWTPNRKGIAVRQEWIPMNIENNIVIGYTYRRAPEFRFTKRFAGDKAAAAFAIVSPEFSFSSVATPINVQGLNISPNAASPNGNIIPSFLGPINTAGISVAGTTTGTQNGYAPDLIGKIAFDPGYGHYEVKAMARFYRDYVVPTGTSTTAAAFVNGPNVGHGDATSKYGWGFGATAILPATKKVDFIVSGAAGAGIGTYNDISANDVTLNNKLELQPIKTVSAIAGLELHPTPKLDIYGYAGGEYYNRNVYTLGPGYLLPSASVTNPTGVTGTNPTGNPTATTASTQVGYGAGAAKNLYQFSAGYYYRFYRGSYGTFQQGLNYNYYWRNIWANGVPARGSDRGFENAVFADFRYILP